MIWPSSRQQSAAVGRFFHFSVVPIEAEPCEHLCLTGDHLHRRRENVEEFSQNLGNNEEADSSQLHNPPSFKDRLSRTHISQRQVTSPYFTQHRYDVRLLITASSTLPQDVVSADYSLTLLFGDFHVLFIWHFLRFFESVFFRKPSHPLI